jgi:hypothetical protein
MNIIERVKAPTPKFFVKLRNISLVLASLGATLLAYPAALPALVVKLAGYLAVAGAVGSTVSQSVTNGEGDTGNPDPNGQQLS